MALNGVRVVEFTGIAPGPFAGLILADYGASVTRIDKPNPNLDPIAAGADILSRGKKSLAINPKAPSGLEVLKKLISKADVLIDPYRPGVLERLGLGPSVFLDKDHGLNPRLIYARLLGFPSKGEYGQMAGHVLNFIALSGLLSMMPRQDGIPMIPLNLIADFAGDGLICAKGILLALIQRGQTGHGQVVNVDIVSGIRYFSSFTLVQTMLKLPNFDSPPGENLFDGGCPYCNIYICADTDPEHAFIAVSCLLPQFFVDFVSRFVLIVGPDSDGWTPTPETRERQEEWPRLKAYLTRGFASRSRDFWTVFFKDTDCCVTPVLTPREAGILAGSRTPLAEAHPRLEGMSSNTDTSNATYLVHGTHNQEVLTELGLSKDYIKQLQAEGVFGAAFRNKL